MNGFVLTRGVSAQPYPTLPEVGAVALARRALSIQGVVVVRRRLFACGVNGGLQSARAANQAVRRFMKVIWQATPLLCGTAARLAEEGHPEAPNGVE